MLNSITSPFALAIPTKPNSAQDELDDSEFITNAKPTNEQRCPNVPPLLRKVAEFDFQLQQILSATCWGGEGAR